MARNGAGVYSLPAGSIVINGDTSDATDVNTPLADLEIDMNTPRPVVAGGTGASSAAAALVNLGLTATAAELNIMDGVTATTAEINKLAGTPAGLTATEIGYLDGVTSAIQAQLNGKQATITTLPLANGGTGAALADPNADRILFWDDSAGAMAFLDVGAGLSITGTVLSSGARVPLATRTASASPTLDFTEFNNAVYKWYEFELELVRPATDATRLLMQFSTNGGASYDAGASDYSNMGYEAEQAGALNNDGSTGSSIIISSVTHTVGNAAGELGVSGTLKMYNAGISAAHTRVKIDTSFENSSGLHNVVNSWGRRNLVQDTDAVRFLYSSGNTSTGEIRMYGVVA